MTTVRTSRDEIVAALRSALDGTKALPCDRSLNTIDWLALDKDEKSALLQVHNWQQDEPLRRAFLRHAEYSNRRLEHLISILG